eukprot:c7977_g1_i1.p1 GENE.c7977_g1_i1~~c7977_g1_i1.p1  ORF type:complete len:203 (+),score=48.61 c7977_g1_i1:69-677(+)
MRPTHFFAVRLTSPTIINNIKAIQQQLIGARPDLAAALIPTSQLHITLGVLHVRSVEHLQNLQDAIKQSTFDLRNFSFRLDGVGAFGDTVVYGRISENQDQLLALRLYLDGVLSQVQEIGGFCTTQFTPHATIAKTSRMRSRRGGPRQQGFGAEVVSMFETLAIGSQEAGCVELLEMKIDKRDGYYKRCFRIGLSESDSLQD